MFTVDGEQPLCSLPCDVEIPAKTRVVARWHGHSKSFWVDDDVEIVLREVRDSDHYVVAGSVTGLGLAGVVVGSVLMGSAAGKDLEGYGQGFAGLVTIIGGGMTLIGYVLLIPAPAPTTQGTPLA